MQLSSSTCRAQQAHQHALALSAPLANVRQIATLAAAAWAKEALAADKREERMLRRGLIAAAEGELFLEPTAPGDRTFSENPDRGHADDETVSN